MHHLWRAEKESVPRYWRCARRSFATEAATRGGETRRGFSRGGGGILMGQRGYYVADFRAVRLGTPSSTTSCLHPDGNQQHKSTASVNALFLSVRSAESNNWCGVLEHNAGCQAAV